MQDKHKIIITGGSGFLGSALVKHFSEKQFQVIALVRRKPEKPIAGVEYSLFKLNEQIDENIFKGATHFIHCAYIKTDQNINALTQNIEGTKKLVDLCRKNSVSKLIFISSLSAKPDIASVYGQQKFKCERLFSGASDLIVRPGLIIGNGGLMASLTEQIKKNKFIPLIDGGKQELQTISISDLVLAIDKCLEQNIYGTLTLAENKPLTFKAFCTAICDTLNLKRKFISIPYWMAYGGLSLLNAVGIKASLNKDNLIGLKQSSTANTSGDSEKIGITIRDHKTSLLEFSNFQTRS